MSQRKQVYNPFLPLEVYIADGEPHVFGDRIYLFGSHDKEGGESFCMLDYEVWSAPLGDLSDWSSPGTSYSSKQDPNSDTKRPYMYAPDVVQGMDGNYYLYYCLAGWKGAGGYSGPISVAVCDRPDGKYEYLESVKNPDGTVFSQFVAFDPAVINDQGIIRLYYGTAMPKGMAPVGMKGYLMAPFIKNIYGKQTADFHKTPGPLGANMVELSEDMLTVKGEAKRILPENPKRTDFKGHGFFEASSIRKIGKNYYFIYSSQKNHELCYAISQYPDREFSFGGTIISNGDVGFQERKDSKRLNATGTTHGSIECINGQWYVFYHRLTHGSDYSRQACAEPITIQPNGEIKQVPVSSCGLNGGPLLAEGSYPATIACNLTNGHMPHISNKVWPKSIPRISHDEKDRFIKDIENRTNIAYKSFLFTQEKGRITIRIRGKGSGMIYLFADDKKQEKIAAFSVTEGGSEIWQELHTGYQVKKGIHPLYFVYRGYGKIDFLEFMFSNDKDAEENY